MFEIVALPTPRGTSHTFFLLFISFPVNSRVSASNSATTASCRLLFHLFITRLSLSAVHLQLLKLSEKPGFSKCLLSSQYDKILSYYTSPTRQTAPAPAVGIFPHLPTYDHIKHDILLLTQRLLSSYKILFTD